MIAPMLTAYPAPGAAGATARPVWIDLLLPTAEERERVAAEFGVRVPAREALQEIESSSRLRAEGQVLTLSMPLIVPEDRTDPVPAPLGLILSPTLFVTVRFTEVHGIAELRARLDKGGDAPVDSSAAFAALIEAMVDYRADLLESIGASTGGISRRVFARHAPRTRRADLDGGLREMLTAVGAAGESLSEVRESLLGLQRLVGFACEMAQEWLRPEIRARLATARGDLVSLSDYESHLWGKIQFLLDAILGFINTDQNNIFKVLTIVSVVGIPPTLIASMYGMNFHNMPEYGWRYGYQYVLALIALSTIVPILWFKWRRWW
ncbi:MAG TPA: magnesium transporter CorA family protein [Steroidobacteraceae bacterium]|jgi:magnesium transporter|nr:magnesium transporter CorA family protein [Steroidobacteraceae bacterium]